MKSKELLETKDRIDYYVCNSLKDEVFPSCTHENVFDISKIVIRGGSGWCIADEAYDDKVTVTSESISYEYRPLIRSILNPTRKWSYKTTSPIFTKLYADLVKAMPAIVNHATDQFCTDVGGIEFILTYADKTKFKQTFFLPGDEFKDCFQIIKRMVPECEYVPAVLLTEDDYEDSGIVRIY